MKAKLAERKEKRALEAKLAKVKRLADDSDDESASAWVTKNRKLTEERLKAEKKVSSFLNSEFRNFVSNFYIFSAHPQCTVYMAILSFKGVIGFWSVSHIGDTT